MKKLVLPKSVYRDAEVGKVTAGVPSLDPLKRGIIEAKGYKQEWQNGAIMEADRKAMQPVLPDGKLPVDSVEARMGKMLTGIQVRDRLKKLNPSLIFTENKPLKRFAIYVPNTRKEKDEWADVFYIGGMEIGPMPEFEIIPSKLEKRIDPNTGGFTEVRVIDEKGQIQRGWRTVVMRLIASGAITRQQAERAFGLPTRDSERWALHMGDR